VADIYAHDSPYFACRSDISTKGLMNWIVRAAVGPSLWAIAFAVIYALHGAGCAQGWQKIATPWGGTVQQVMLISVFVLALVLSWLALQKVPRGNGVKAVVITAGGWIGFAGILLTLFPVLGLTTCQ